MAANNETEALEVLLDGVLDSLDTLGYKGPLKEESVFRDAVKQGLNSENYTQLLHSLCGELKTSLSLQETVSLPQGSTEDHEAFQFELRGFLAELKCPHADLTTDVCLLSSYKKRLLVLEYLESELIACRLTLLRQSRDQAMETSDHECDSVAANLSAILKLYGFNKPPSTVTVKQIYDRIIGKTRAILADLPANHLGVGMVIQALSEQQWVTLEHINQSLTQEYAVRREMLLTRADVTIQSLGWSDKVKGNEDSVTKIYREHRNILEAVAPVSIARVLAAKNDLLKIQKTSHQAVRVATQSFINKAVLVGKVPDRGGRPRETRPPPEMPSFKKRTETFQDQRSQGRGGKRGGSDKYKGRVQGSWGGGGGGSGGWGLGSNSGPQGSKTPQEYYS